MYNKIIKVFLSLLHQQIFMKKEIRLINLKSQQIEHVRKSEFYIEDTHVRYILDFDSSTLKDPDDEMMGWTESKSSYLDVFLKKEFVAGIELSSTEHDYWIVLITSPDQNIRIYFDYDEKDLAEELKEELIAWLLKK
jgi:hypothetical protein